MTEFDTPWKDVLDAWLERFLRFFFPDVDREIDWSRGYDPLEQELRQIAREAETGPRTVDKLFRVWQEDGSEAWVLIHVEIQQRFDADFASRMFSYHYRILDRFGRAPCSLAILCDDRPNWRPSEYNYEQWGCGLNFRFPITKVLDWAGRDEELLSHPNPFSRVVLAHLKTLETRGDPERRYNEKLRLFRDMYESGLTREEIVTLFRFIEWLMDLPRDLNRQFHQEAVKIERQLSMPYITPFEQYAREEGWQEGREEGREEGARHEVLAALQGGLPFRFGDDGQRLFEQIREFDDLSQLRRIRDAMFTAEDLDQLKQVAKSDG